MTRQTLRPYVTLALVLGILGWQLYVTSGAGQADAQTLMRFGARKANLGFPQAPWRLLASVFLHFNWWHLISNLIVLGVWGACLERVLGRLEMLAIFLLAGVWGSLMSDLYGPSVLAMGASGAAFAMVGTVLSLAVLARDWPQWEGESRRWATVSLVALVLNAVTAVGFTSGGGGARLDHWAHGGGALCGLLLGLTPALAGSERRRPVFWATALLLGLAAGLIIVGRGSSPFGG